MEAQGSPACLAKMTHTSYSETPAADSTLISAHNSTNSNLAKAHIKLCSDDSGINVGGGKWLLHCFDDSPEGEPANTLLDIFCSLYNFRCLNTSLVF